MGARAGAIAFILAAPVALAAAPDDWPPPPEVLGRMRELQSALAKRDATPAERESARAELEKLLKSPAGRERPTFDAAKRKPRAAIEPFPGIAPPAGGKLPQAPPVAKLEPVPRPRRPAVDPATGAALPPSPGSTIDPHTGRVLHEVPGGYVDPQTGRFVPR